MPPSESATLRSGKRRSVGPEEQVLRDQHRDLGREHDEVVDRRFGCLLDEVEAGADVQRQHHVLVAHRLQHRVPVAGQEAREALRVRCLEEADRPAALLADPLDLLHREVDVPHRDDAERDEAARVRRAPLVDDPVVVGLEHHERQLLVARLGEGAGVEAGHRREVHRCEHAVDVHVAHALVHVQAARAQLGERAGVEAPLLTRPADRGGHAERGRGALALERPLVDAVLVADDLRRLIEPLGRDVVLVHVGRLDHVVVDADQDHVVHLHGSSSRHFWTWPKTLPTGGRRGTPIARSARSALLVRNAVRRRCTGGRS